MGTTITLALSVLEALPALIQAGQDVSNLIATTANTIKTAQAEGRDPNEAEWAAIDAQREALSAALHS